VNRTDIGCGDLVEVNGVSDPGSFAPMVLPKTVVSLGTAAMPSARTATLFQLATANTTANGSRRAASSARSQCRII